MATTDRRDVRTSDLSEFEIRRAELVGQIGDVRPVIPTPQTPSTSALRPHLDMLALGAHLFHSH